MQQDKRTKREKETTQNQQTVEPSSSYEKNIKIRSPKPDFENQDEQRLSTTSQLRGRQHKRQLNSDPTQGDVVPDISQI